MSNLHDGCSEPWINERVDQSFTEIFTENANFHQIFNRTAILKLPVALGAVKRGKSKHFLDNFYKILMFNNDPVP